MGFNSPMHGALKARLDQCEESKLRELYIAAKSIESDLPFTDLLWPLVTIALEETDKQRIIRFSPILGNPTLEIASIDFPCSVTHHLLNRVAWIFSRSLYDEFSAFRGLGRTLSALIKDPSECGNQTYNEFCERALYGKYQMLFSKYPVLIELLLIETTNWVECICRFARRLKADHEDLCAFLKTSSAIEIAAIKMDVSDSHNGGRRAIILETKEEQRIVYKEKPPDPDILFDNFSALFNNSSGGDYIKSTKKVIRSDYFWSEFIIHSPCLSAKETAEFYYNAGILICITYSLRISDCHYENIIAAGRFPILIDVETLGGFTVALPESTLNSIVVNSVTSIGIIPTPLTTKNHEIIDFSGLGAKSDRLRTHLKWQCLKSDYLCARNVKDAEGCAQNSPHSDGGRHIQEYSKTIRDGFEFAYRLIVINRSIFRELALSFNCRINSRIIIRDTNSYYSILNTILNPEFVCSPLAWKTKLMELINETVKTPLHTPDLIHGEFTQLGNLDIPYFTLKHIADKKPPIESIIDKMSAADCATQMAIIKQAVEA
jgi:type 2 lantibiotic biosynthesis protein LanM